jgi:hypothetical protein
MFVPMRELLKAAVPIPPVLVLLYVLHALRAGRVIGRWGTYIRATDVGRYWSGIGTWVLVALVMVVIGLRVFL